MAIFYLVRSPNCYHKRTFEQSGSPQGKLDTIAEAMEVAVQLATETQKTQLVYEVRLVGRAAIAEATWIPEKTDVKT